MARYGEAAVWATRIAVEEKKSPNAAWLDACLRLHPKSIYSAIKGCPRTTYLTLCEEGCVRGIPAGKYVDGRENTAHALALLYVLRQDEDLVDASTQRLWKLAGGEDKTENGQVEVVVALWRAGLIVDPS